LSSFSRTIQTHLRSLEACNKFLKEENQAIFRVKVINSRNKEEIMLVNDGMKLLKEMLMSDGELHIEVTIEGIGLLIKKEYAIVEGECKMVDFKGWIGDERLEFEDLMTTLDDQLQMNIKLKKPGVIFPNLFIAL